MKKGYLKPRTHRNQSVRHSKYSSHKNTNYFTNIRWNHVSDELLRICVYSPSFCNSLFRIISTINGNTKRRLLKQNLRTRYQVIEPFISVTYRNNRSKIIISQYHIWSTLNDQSKMFLINNHVFLDSIKQPQDNHIKHLHKKKELLYVSYYSYILIGPMLKGCGN